MLRSNPEKHGNAVKTDQATAILYMQKIISDYGPKVPEGDKNIPT